jgi:hypothetical protein
MFDEHDNEQSKVPLPVTKKRKSKGDATTKPSKKKKSTDSRSKTTKKRNPFTDITNTGKMQASEKSIHIETIPSFSDVKPLLEKSGCVFRANMYCRPGGKDPETDGSAREGHDYFINEDDFRKDLCAHGLAIGGGRSCKIRKDMLDELEKAKLDTWIRFSIVTSMRHEHGIANPTRPVFTGNAHHLLLEKLGFEYKGGEYTIPGDSRKRVTSIDQHISYYGLPDECYFDRISDDERRYLEVHSAKTVRN